MNPCLTIYDQVQVREVDAVKFNDFLDNLSNFDEISRACKTSVSDMLLMRKLNIS